MNFDVKLTIYEGSGQVRELPVGSSRFSIGRGADNDLQIDDKGLSRRHLILDIFDDVVQLTDCGSQNGTMVNRQPVGGSVRLKDGDSILIGYACDIRVHIQAKAQIAAGAANPFKPEAQVGESSFQPYTSSDKKNDGNKVPMIAIASIIGIVFISAVLLLIININSDDKPKPLVKNEDITLPNDANFNSRDVVNNPPPANDNENQSVEVPTNNSSSKMIETLGAKMLSRISKDHQRYIFRESALRDITQTIERLKSSSSTASAIASVRNRKGRILESSKRLGLAGGFGVYAVLAESDARGNDAEQEILGNLAFVATTCGAGTIENALVALAAYKEGTGSVKSHPLLVRIRGKVDPQTQRNVWYLREHNFISEAQYNFVVKFIALGIIAENPGFFGINTEPLAF
ncbi:MAG: FHA domain-containing protein [Acidobacteriota bacterium]